MAEKTLSEALQDCTIRCQNMEAPLTARLEAFANDVRKLSPDFADIVDRMIEHLKTTGVGENAPKPGEPLPHFMMPDQKGRLQTLDDLIAKGPWALVSILPDQCASPRRNLRRGEATWRRARRDHSGKRAFQRGIDGGK